MGVRASHIQECKFVSCHLLISHFTPTSKVKAPNLTILGKTTCQPLPGAHQAASLGKPLRASHLVLEPRSQPQPDTGALAPQGPAHRPELSQLSEEGWEERPKVSL